ncbi:MAG: M23 family metallopeptidase [Mariprofundales bacterium]
MSAANAPDIYEVRHGDTLYRIGKRFGIHYTVIARHNHINPPYTIYTGQHLYLKKTHPYKKPLPLYAAKKIPKQHTHVNTATSRQNTTRRPQTTSASLAKPKPVKFIWPIKGKVNISSSFGKLKDRVHDGIDISTPLGTPIYAAASGIVVYADNKVSGYGNMVILRHSSTFFTTYAHNSRNNVKKGDSVVQGKKIADSGESGRTTGPHIHFEIRRGVTPLNPLAYLPHR